VKVEFRHIVRIASTELKGKTPLKLALTKIKGIGPSVSNALVKILKLDPKRQIGDFSDEELFSLEEFLKSPKGFPDWMMNRQKDTFTGETSHLISTDLEIAKKKDIDFMKKIRTYRGMRHAFGLKVRGQRTKNTGRHGKTIGVQRKTLIAAAKAKREEEKKEGEKK
jgi:small subunit ribosomal protein S13